MNHEQSNESIVQVQVVPNHYTFQFNGKSSMKSNIDGSNLISRVASALHEQASPTTTNNNHKHSNTEHEHDEHDERTRHRIRR